MSCKNTFNPLKLRTGNIFHMHNLKTDTSIFKQNTEFLFSANHLIMLYIYAMFVEKYLQGL